MSLSAANLKRLRAEVIELQQARMAPATERGYAGDFRLFRRWCLIAGRRALPASPATLNLFIADRLRTCKVVSVRRSIAGIAFLQVREGFRSPADDTVRQTLRGASRLRAEQPRQMRPLTVPQLRRIVGGLDGSPASTRNRALLVLGFASGLRRSNLAALLLEDLTFRAEGVILLVRREKQNREGGAGRRVGVPFGKYPLTCTVGALRDWLKIRGEAPGALFIRLDNGSSGDFHPLAATSIERIVKGAIAAAGIDPRDYGPHSLRSGIIAAAGIAGVPSLAIQKHIGHRSAQSTAGYFRPADLFRCNPAGLVDL